MPVDKQEIMDQVKIMVMAYSLKRMANALDKSYSTLSNELDERDWAKLGFRTVLTMLGLALEPGAPAQSHTAALKALNMMEAGFGRVAYTIPNIADGGVVEGLKLIADLSAQYAGDIRAFAGAVDDGRWTAREAERCLEQNRELLRSCLRISAYLTQLKESLK